VIVAVTVAETTDVGIVNVALVAPAGTKTVVGGFALELFDESVTLAPLDGAAPLRVTVPVVATPPITVVGETVRDVIVAGFTVSEADLDTPP
jgi:hypothetical protein